MANREGSPAFRGWAILIAAGVLTVVIGFVVFFRGADGVEPNAWRSLPDVPEVVVVSCAGCHDPPNPDELARADWFRSLARMRSIMAEQAGVQLTDYDYFQVWKYFRNHSPDTLPILAQDPVDSPILFVADSIAPPEGVPPLITSVQAVDFDADGTIEILVSDARRNTVSMMSMADDRWKEKVIGHIAAPARAEVHDLDGDGDQDIVVASLGILPPTDELVGSVVLLRSISDGYRTEVLLSDVGRVADVRVGDIDADGDMDLAVAIFGHISTGAIVWMEQVDGGTFRYHELEAVSGASHVPIVDLDGDGLLDIVALISQASEKIDVFMNHGFGVFKKRTLFRAPTPLFGSSGISPVDLDQDGDIDFIYSNGDAFDVPAAQSTSMLRPYHGVQWLENRGRRGFVSHDLLRYYGAFSPIPADLDEDGDTDIVVTSLVNDWADESRRSLIWLENDGSQQFTAHGIASSPTHLVSADVADIDGNGRLDIVAGGLHMFPPYNRLGRVTVWANQGSLGQ